MTLIQKPVCVSQERIGLEVKIFTGPFALGNRKLHRGTNLDFQSQFACEKEAWKLPNFLIFSLDWLSVWLGKHYIYWGAIWIQRPRCPSGNKIIGALFRPEWAGTISLKLRVYNIIFIIHDAESTWEVLCLTGRLTAVWIKPAKQVRLICNGIRQTASAITFDGRSVILALLAKDKRFRTPSC